MRQQLKLISDIYKNVDRLVAVVDLQETFLYANEKASRLLFGRPEINEASLISHDDYIGKAAECKDKFIAEDKLAVSSDKMVKIFGCYCYENNDWRILLGGKNRFSLDNKPAIWYDYMDVTYTKLRRLGMMLTDSHRKIFFDNDWRQTSYILTDSYDSLGLSKRQSECLFYMIQGKSAKEIAIILNRSYRTIESHIDQIKQKMYCNTRSEIISKVFDLKLDTTIPSSIMICEN